MGKSALDRIDIPGTLLLLFATLALTAGFEEADARFPWRSAYVITLLILSGVLWISLVLWERHVTTSSHVREPVLPWRFLTNRRMISLLLYVGHLTRSLTRRDTFSDLYLFTRNFTLLGGPIIVSYFIIPQRYQLVYGMSGLDAGVRLIPFTVILPIGTIFSSILAGKKIPPIYILISWSCLQVIGFALLSTLPTTSELPLRMYGFEVIAGWGCGMNFTLLLVAVPFVTEKRDHGKYLSITLCLR